MLNYFVFDGGPPAPQRQAYNANDQRQRQRQRYTVAYRSCTISYSSMEIHMAAVPW